MIEPIDLVAAVNAHLEKTGEAPSAFGRRVAKDPQLVRDLRRGRSIGITLANQIIGVINAEMSSESIPE